LLFVIHVAFSTNEEKQSKKAEKMRFGPVKARMVSKDPRVQWDQEVQLDWRPVVRREIGETDTERIFELGEWQSSPIPVNAMLSKLGLE
jgi:hypothetical protein